MRHSTVNGWTPVVNIHITAWENRGPEKLSAILTLHLRKSSHVNGRDKPSILFILLFYFHTLGFYKEFLRNGKWVGGLKIISSCKKRGPNELTTFLLCLLFIHQSALCCSLAYSKALTPETRLSEPWFSEILDLMNKLQLPLSYFTLYPNSI